MKIKLEALLKEELAAEGIIISDKKADALAEKVIELGESEEKAQKERRKAAEKPAPAPTEPAAPASPPDPKSHEPKGK